MGTEPETPSEGRTLMKVDVALFVLRGGWVNGRELLEGVSTHALNILGRPASYDNANACVRNARVVALRRGKCFQFMAVGENEGGPGSDHRLWTVTEEAVPRPHPAWQTGRATVVMETEALGMKDFERPDMDTLGEASDVRGRRTRTKVAVPASGNMRAGPSQARDGFEQTELFEDQD